MQLIESADARLIVPPALLRRLDLEADPFFTEHRDAA
jgi:hypothetical protein